MNRFSDFAVDEQNLQGRKISMNEIIGKEVAFHAFRIFPSSKVDGADCMQMQFDIEGEVCVSFTGSGVLMRQMKQYEKQLPFMATIVKRGKYLTLS